MAIRNPYVYKVIHMEISSRFSISIWPLDRKSECKALSALGDSSNKSWPYLRRPEISLYSTFVLSYGYSLYLQHLSFRFILDLNCDPLSKTALYTYIYEPQLEVSTLNEYWQVHTIYFIILYKSGEQTLILLRKKAKN